MAATTTKTRLPTFEFLHFSKPIDVDCEKVAVSLRDRKAERATRVYGHLRVDLANDVGRHSAFLSRSDTATFAEHSDANSAAFSRSVPPHLNAERLTVSDVQRMFANQEFTEAAGVLEMIVRELIIVRKWQMMV